MPSVQSPNVEPPPVVPAAASSDDNKQAGDGPTTGAKKGGRSASVEPPPVAPPLLTRAKSAGRISKRAHQPHDTPSAERDMRLKWVRANSAPNIGDRAVKKLRPSPVQIPSLQILDRPAPDRYSPANRSPLSHRMSPATGRFSPMTTGRMTPPGGRSAGGTLRNEGGPMRLNGGSSPITGGRLSPIYGTGLATPPSRGGYTNKKSALSSTVCPGHTRPVVGLTYTQNTEMGSLLLSACLDGIPMFRYDNGDWIGSFLGHKGGVWCARANRAKHASEAATLVVTGSADYCARLWDGQNGNALSSFKHESIVRACDFTEDGMSFFTGGKEKLIRLFSIAKREESWQAECEHQISGLVALSDTNMLLTHSTEAPVIKLWDIRTKSSVKSLDLPGKVQSIQRNHGGNLLTVCAGTEVSFWDLETFTKKDFLTVESDKGNLATASTNEELSLCVTAQEDSTTVDVWNYKEAKHMCSLRGHHGEVQAIAWEPSGKNFATGARDAAIRIWQVEGTELDSRRTPTGKAFFERRAKQRSVLDAFTSAQTKAQAKKSPTTAAKSNPTKEFKPKPTSFAEATGPPIVPSKSSLSSGAKAFVPNPTSEAFVPKKITLSPAVKSFVPKADAPAFVPSPLIKAFVPRKSPLCSAAKAFVPTAKAVKDFMPKPSAMDFVPIFDGPPAMPESPPPMPLSGSEAMPVPEMPLSAGGSPPPEMPNSPTPPPHAHLLMSQSSYRNAAGLDSPPGSPPPGPAGGPPASPPLSGIAGIGPPPSSP